MFALIFETYSFSLVFKRAPKTFLHKMKHFVPWSMLDELEWNPIKTTAISIPCVLVPGIIICMAQTISQGMNCSIKHRHGHTVINGSPLLLTRACLSCLGENNESNSSQLLCLAYWNFGWHRSTQLVLN